jgi:hypothetical protein
MLTVTVDDIMSWGPCSDYPRERIKKLFGRKRKATALDVLKSEIPAKDKLWAVLREEMIPANILHEFACRCAENALLKEREAGREPHADSWRAIEVKRLWLQGKASDQELAAARGAARDAAWAAARDAAMYAAWAAAMYAARDAAWAAARAAAMYAAWAAAGAAARDEQVDMLIKYLSD